MLPGHAGCRVEGARRCVGMCSALGELAQARIALARALALTGPGGDADVLAHSDAMLAHVERAAGNRTSHVPCSSAVWKGFVR